MPNVIDVQTTPNPDALKFVLSEAILTAGVRQFDSPQAAGADPLAKKLFDVSGVRSVFYMAKFVTVTKEASAPWPSLQPALISAIESTSVAPVAPASYAARESSLGSGGDSALLAEINRVLDANVRPALAGDGGGLEVLGLEGTTLHIYYQGACGSCPSATAGTLNAVQNLLQRMVDPRLTVVSAPRPV